MKWRDGKKSTNVDDKRPQNPKDMTSLVEKIVGDGGAPKVKTVKSYPKPNRAKKGDMKVKR